MLAWWPVYGEPSLVAGVLAGVVWGLFSSARRRRHFKRAGLEPTSPWLWFFTSLISMGSYVALVVALCLMALNDVLEPVAMWFLLGAAGLAFCTALLFARFQSSEHSISVAPTAELSAEEVRKTA